jgi:hypothetical protein
MEALVLLRMGVPEDLPTDSLVVRVVEAFSLSAGVGVAAFCFAFKPGTA